MKEDRSRKCPQADRILQNDRKIAEQPDSLRCQRCIYEVIKHRKYSSKPELREQFVHVGPVQQQTQIPVPEQKPDTLAEAAYYVPRIAFVEQETATGYQECEHLLKQPSCVALVEQIMRYDEIELSPLENSRQ